MQGQDRGRVRQQEELSRGFPIPRRPPAPHFLSVYMFILPVNLGGCSPRLELPFIHLAVHPPPPGRSYGTSLRRYSTEHLRDSNYVVPSPWIQ